MQPCAPAAPAEQRILFYSCRPSVRGILLYPCAGVRRAVCSPQWRTRQGHLLALHFQPQQSDPSESRLGAQPLTLLGALA
jgi:hypothetical protein